MRWHELVVTAGPAAVYLAVVSLSLVRTGRCFWWVHPAAVVVGGGVRVAVAGPAALLPVLIAGVLFVPGALAGRWFLSGPGLMSTLVTVALLPLEDAPAVLVGVLLIGLASIAAVLRDGGAERLRALRFGTAVAVTVPLAGLSRPDLALLPATRVPVRARVQGAAEDGGVAGEVDPGDGGEAPGGYSPGRPAGRSLYLAPYLLAGLVVWVAFLELLAR